MFPYLCVSVFLSVWLKCQGQLRSVYIIDHHALRFLYSGFPFLPAHVCPFSVKGDKQVCPKGALRPVQVLTLNDATTWIFFCFIRGVTQPKNAVSLFVPVFFLTSFRQDLSLSRDTNNQLTFEFFSFAPLFSVSLYTLFSSVLNSVRGQ